MLGLLATARTAEATPHHHTHGELGDTAPHLRGYVSLSDFEIAHRQEHRRREHRRTEPTTTTTTHDPHPQRQLISEGLEARELQALNAIIEAHHKSSPETTTTGRQLTSEELEARELQVLNAIIRGHHRSGFETTPPSLPLSSSEREEIKMHALAALNAKAGSKSAYLASRPG